MIIFSESFSSSLFCTTKENKNYLMVVAGEVGKKEKRKKEDEIGSHQSNFEIPRQLCTQQQKNENLNTAGKILPERLHNDLYTHRARYKGKAESTHEERVAKKIDKKKFPTKNLIICRLFDIGQKGEILIMRSLNCTHTAKGQKAG